MVTDAAVRLAEKEGSVGPAGDRVLSLLFSDRTPAGLEAPSLHPQGLDG